MTSKNRTKSFDCVKSVREIRDRISAEIANMSYEELRQWLDARVQQDPFFARIPQFRASNATETMQDAGRAPDPRLEPNRTINDRRPSSGDGRAVNALGASPCSPT